jgi:diguanylate cyclase
MSLHVMRQDFVSDTNLSSKIAILRSMAHLDEHSQSSMSRNSWHEQSHKSVERPIGQGTSVTWQQQLFADAGQFMFSKGLDPTPANYELAYQFCAAHNVDLVKAVRSEIEKTGGLAADAAERILATSAGPIGVEALSALTEQIQVQAQGLSDIAIQSAEDTGAFLADLEVKSIAENDTSQILEMTKAMMSRTRLAELQLREAHKELGVLKSKLDDAQHAADIDPLTGLLNRRAFKRELEKALEPAMNNGDPVSIAFCDIDHFKRFNDLHGHATGDRVLRYVASKLEKETEGAAFVGRFGGEEFVVAFSGLSLGEACKAIDQARLDLSKRRLKSVVDNADLGCVSFSAGVSTLGAADSMTEMLRRADDALYRAKTNGRNRVEQQLEAVSNR